LFCGVVLDLPRRGHCRQRGEVHGEAAVLPRVTGVRRHSKPRKAEAEAAVPLLRAASSAAGRSSSVPERVPTPKIWHPTTSVRLAPAALPVRSGPRSGRMACGGGSASSPPCSDRRPSLRVSCARCVRVLCVMHVCRVVCVRAPGTAACRLALQPGSEKRREAEKRRGGRRRSARQD
jgi:hypothetical protein